MTVLPIFKMIRTNADLLKIFGDRIYDSEAPLETKAPYIVWQIVSGTPYRGIDCAGDTDNLMFQVMIYDTNQLKAMQLREQVRQVLENDCIINNSQINLKDPVTKLHGRGFDANWILER
ncbi:DUF3168 domain-containing protein [Acinetobacter rudis]|uniref:DUF3168 domain-containing protein n=1 Tax=Acinetobacter rudis TaxID=632955 RepID=UPI00280FE53C|nr:DUF3168 domain-containing protein [Acinetobacter rudis]MDQ8951943.1 DUF3168 domain-containing protein [Acinetobacter rudis]